MTTSTTDAEAIARETWRAIETYLDAECNLGSCGDLSDADRANCENFITNAILSYLASRQEAQEPVAYAYYYDGRRDDADHPIASRNRLSALQKEPWTEVPLYTAPPAPSGEVERLVKPIIDRLEWNGRLQQWVVRPDLPAGTIKAARAALNGGRE